MSKEINKIEKILQELTDNIEREYGNNVLISNFIDETIQELYQAIMDEINEVGLNGIPLIKQTFAKLFGIEREQ